MKVYAGDRTIDGIVVTVNGVPLDDHFNSKRYSDGGFEWSYEGAAPSQLAYAILCDHLGDTGRQRPCRIASCAQSWLTSRTSGR